MTILAHFVFLLHSRKTSNKPYDKVLGAAQFTERTSISCHKLSKVVKSCHKLSKVGLLNSLPTSHY